MLVGELGFFFEDFPEGFVDHEGFGEIGLEDAHLGLEVLDFVGSAFSGAAGGLVSGYLAADQAGEGECT